MMNGLTGMGKVSLLVTSFVFIFRTQFLGENGDHMHGSEAGCAVFDPPGSIEI
jgi:hypothetical protein